MTGRKQKRGGRPSKWSPRVGEELARLVSRGDTIEEVARSVGVHPATVYRWQNERPEFYNAMLRAGRMRFRLLHPPGYDERPRVPWRKDCPACGFGAVVVRTTWGLLRFWTCERWPRCRFSSWRPPAPVDCPLCSVPLFFSHSRKSLGCDSCGYRAPNV